MRSKERASSAKHEMSERKAVVLGAIAFPSVMGFIVLMCSSKYAFVFVALFGIGALMFIGALMGSSIWGNYQTDKILSNAQERERKPK